MRTDQRVYYKYPCNEHAVISDLDLKYKVVSIGHTYWILDKHPENLHIFYGNISGMAAHVDTRLLSLLPRGLGVRLIYV